MLNLFRNFFFFLSHFFLATNDNANKKTTNKISAHRLFSLKPVNSPTRQLKLFERFNTPISFFLFKNRILTFLEILKNAMVGQGETLKIRIIVFTG